MVITDVILPIAFIVLLGFLLRRFGGKYEHAFSKTQLYILGPALLFSVMARNDTGSGLLLEILLYVIILSAGLLLLTQGIGKMAGGGRAERNAMSLAGVFTNSGFYGIPVCMLAFGRMVSSGPLSMSSHLRQFSRHSASFSPARENRRPRQHWRRYSRCH